MTFSVESRSCGLFLRLVSSARGWLHVYTRGFPIIIQLKGTIAEVFVLGFFSMN
jgi:hypothetical protein